MGAFRRHAAEAVYLRNLLLWLDEKRVEVAYEHAAEHELKQAYLAVGLGEPLYDVLEPFVLFLRKRLKRRDREVHKRKPEARRDRG